MDEERGIIYICVKSLVYIFSGLVGSFGSAVDDKGANELARFGG